MEFVIRDRGKQGKAVVLELAGRLTLAEGGERLEGAVQDLLERGENAVLLEMSQVPAIDSRGLKSLVTSYTSLKKRNGTLKLLHLSRRVREVLDYTRLLTVIDAFEDEQAALQSF
jgi:anti-sigma B factor antagonist